MSENNFEREMRDRLIRIETKQDYMIQTVDNHSEVINKHSERITKVEESTKSAHHRIDGIYLAAGLFGALAGTITNFFASIWKSGGHGP